MKEIKLTKNQKTLVDESIYDFLNSFSWNAKYEKKNKTYYAAKNIADFKKIRKTCLMHWVIAGHPLKGYVVDHINGNTLDNRSENLRIVTYAENMRNTKKHRAGKLLGTSYHVGNKKWQSFILINGKQKHLGLYNSEKEAHEAYLNFKQSYE